MWILWYLNNLINSSYFLILYFAATFNDSTDKKIEIYDISWNSVIFKVIFSIFLPEVFRIEAIASRIMTVLERMLWVTKQQKATRKQATQMKNDNKVCGFISTAKSS